MMDPFLFRGEAKEIKVNKARIIKKIGYRFSIFLGLLFYGQRTVGSGLMVYGV